MSHKAFFVSLSLLVCAIISLLIALKLGTYDVSLKSILIDFSHLDPIAQDVLLNLRLPRVFAAFTTGALLALAGVLMQVLLRNPLADPYILGVSGGGAFGNMLALIFGLNLFWLHAFTFMGAIFSWLLIYLLLILQRQWSSQKLMLIGITLAFTWSALISFMLCLMPNQLLHNVFFWLLGDLNAISTPYFAALFVLIIGGYCWLNSRQLNLLQQGDLTAKSLGLNTKTLSLQIFCLASFLSATAITIAGPIGFIGLIVPHLIRLILGANHRWLIPNAMLAGGILLTLADTAARTLFTPQQIPTGIFTALIGIPIFLFLLTRRHHDYA